MSQAVSNFITRLMVHFPFKHESQAAEQEWLAAMTRVLRPYGAEVLDNAAQRIIDTRKDRRFPLPAECCDVCNQVAKAHAAVKRDMQLPWEKADEWSPSRIALADDLVMSPLGKQAAHEGWIGQLHDFCRENAKLPSGSEIATCKAKQARFDKSYEACVRGEAGEQSKALERLGANIRAKAEKLRLRVLGEAA